MAIGAATRGLLLLALVAGSNGFQFGRWKSKPVSSGKQQQPARPLGSAASSADLQGLSGT